MTMIQTPFPQFFDGAGNDLDAGFVYIGEAGANPETSPITVYSDVLLTQPMAQPLRTINGHIVSGFSPIAVFMRETECSITVRTSSGALVYSTLRHISPEAYMPQGAGAVTRSIQEKLHESVSVFDFMTADQIAGCVTGTVDVTAAIQTAINSIISGTILFPAGTYKVTDTITISKPYVNLLGQGEGARGVSNIHFVPPSAKTCILFDAVAGGLMYNNSIRNISLSSVVADGDFTKIAIETKDADTLLVENVSIIHWYGNNNSVGIKTGGRQFLKFRNIYIYADKPLQISQNPYRAAVANIDIDHARFENMFLVSTNGANNPCVTIDTGVNLTNVTFDGHQAWVPYAAHGLYWNDTTSSAASANLSLNNIRIEHDIDATKYMFYISTNSGLQNLQINNVYGGLGSNGIFLRAMTSANIKNFFYINSSGGVGLNIDNSVWKVVVNDCFWQSGSTASVASHRLVSGTYQVVGPLTENGIYEAATGPGAGNGLMQSAAINGDLSAGLVLRRANLVIQPGTAANTLKAELLNIWNGDVIASTDNIGKGATVGNFSLSADGFTLSILNSGITGVPVAVLSTELQNYTATALFSPINEVSGTSITYGVKGDVSGTSKDMTALGGFSVISFTYLTK